jgi:hypothetical protein
VLPGTVVAEREPFFISLGGPRAHDFSGRDDKGEGDCGPRLMLGEGHKPGRALRQLFQPDVAMGNFQGSGALDFESDEAFRLGESWIIVDQDCHHMAVENVN